MTIKEIQDEIVEEFSSFEEWMDKYAYLIELGNDLEPYNDQYRVEQNILEGCQSKVWLHAWMEDGKVYYMGDSDAIIVKGIVALMIRALSGQSPQDIIDSDLSFIDEIGLKEHLSPTRSNGLVAMIKQMRLFAIAFKAQQA
ncbi:SufE family protein [Saccharicrinis fermentans]|uniref:Cysteine desulfuration protein SufE n=1 Tax=Saccharicrinis fermentans DSM 9555 = JCM 21142 TaxID=869213 RepID=W7Y7H1_9BACT|nr:SufE family protein [Saccharicrinis fermentans]GAF03593.1 cysteine desulfuration protein SufE [Saccharicrinis fermentans DSM 9555 = JCM 21142]